MPWDVGRFKPTQIAAVMGWDLEDAVKVVPIDDTTPAPPRTARPGAPGKRGPRLKAVKKRG